MTAAGVQASVQEPDGNTELTKERSCIEFRTSLGRFDGPSTVRKGSLLFLCNGFTFGMQKTFDPHCFCQLGRTAAQEVFRGPAVMWT